MFPWFGICGLSLSVFIMAHDRHGCSAKPGIRYLNSGKADFEQRISVFVITTEIEQ